MKLATFEIPTAAGPLRRIGAAVDGKLIDFAAGYSAHLEKTDPGCDAQRLAAILFSSDMVAFLGTGDVGRRAAEQAIEAASRHADAFGARTSYAPQEVRLLAPVPRPRVIRDFLTFEGHMLTAGKALGRPSIPPVWYEVPAYYKGDPDTVSGPDDVIEWPKYCEKFDFELELAVVIGRRGKNINKADAKRYIAGYTIWNDWSARDQQMREGPLGMGPSKGKDFDTGNTIGPYLVTADELDVEQPADDGEDQRRDVDRFRKQRPAVFIRGSDRARLAERDDLSRRALGIGNDNRRKRTRARPLAQAWRCR